MVVNVEEEMVVNLVQRVHTDDSSVAATLLELHKAIAAQDVARLGWVLEGAQELLGPHFEFQEWYLHPLLERFSGDRHSCLSESGVDGQVAAATP